MDVRGLLWFIGGHEHAFRAWDVERLGLLAPAVHDFAPARDPENLG